jgi:hypothetical protein
LANGLVALKVSYYHPLVAGRFMQQLIVTKRTPEICAFGPQLPRAVIGGETVSGASGRVETEVARDPLLTRQCTAWLAGASTVADVVD